MSALAQDLPPVTLGDLAQPRQRRRRERRVSAMMAIAGMTTVLISALIIYSLFS